MDGVYFNDTGNKFVFNPDDVIQPDDMSVSVVKAVMGGKETYAVTLDMIEKSGKRCIVFLTPDTMRNLGKSLVKASNKCDKLLNDKTD